MTPLKSERPEASASAVRNLGRRLTKISKNSPAVISHDILDAAQAKVQPNTSKLTYHSFLCLSESDTDPARTPNQHIVVVRFDWLQSPVNRPPEGSTFGMTRERNP
ncbi:hypothetical protein MSSD14B_08100 [Marinobacter salsuginis]|uniref:Uncharacterized protein n=1 Tax=Marinobacter salsuginis TaxID=418719 RepID=A0A5M3PW35_9GAMM|nr:hypothetical protein MSSD14B_08100 [Marinobacter salsuginis]